MNVASYEQNYSYKINLIGEMEVIPKRWSIRRIKEVGSIKYGLSQPPQYLEQGLPLIRATNIERGKIVDKGLVFISPADVPYERNPLLKTNDIIVVRSGAYTADSAIVPDSYDGAVAGFDMVLRPRKIEPKYLAYTLLSNYVLRDQLILSSFRAAQPHLNKEELGAAFIFCPPRFEQKTIVAYLDTKTVQIDRKIYLLRQKAEKYTNLKQSIINETITRGLDKSVSMKESGVEWIGEVPEHWEIKRIGTVFEERREKVNDTDYPPLSVTMNGIVPQLETAAKTDHNDNRKRVAVGDYVINSRSDRRGSSGISIYDGSVSVINIVLNPKKGNFGNYLHHLFRSYRFTEEFYRVGRGIVDDLWTTKYSVMKAIEFASPSTEEQVNIASYLDKKTVEIDEIVGKINLQIDNLTELRKTLINDVVTGKIKVA